VVGLGRQLLWCLLCGARFGIEDVQDGRYLAETGICKGCYDGMQRSGKTCFGKETKGSRLGYDEKAIECQEFCKDRKICRDYVKRLHAVP